MSHVHHPHIILVLGSTGTGKSKLAVDIANHLKNAEIISADAMQLYEGLDIITNKVTKTEMEGVKHHMLSVLSPLTLGFSVLQYRNMALPIIEDILQRGCCAIIVGGTNYYIESLVWTTLIDCFSNSNSSEGATDLSNFINGLPADYFTLDCETLHGCLKVMCCKEKIDPASAMKIHPSNRRKILRSLQVWHQSGSTLTELMKHKSQNHGDSDLTFGEDALRYQKCCALWIQCDEDVLNERLDKRVDKMIEGGLEEEVCAFYDLYFDKCHENAAAFAKLSGNPNAVVKGVFQSIGMKEFLPYLSLPSDEKLSSTGRQLFGECVSQLKLATRQYSRKQVRWIENRFLKRSRPAPPVFSLDGSDLVAWEENVAKPAIAIVDAFVGGREYHMTPLAVEIDSHERSRNDLLKCVTCDRLIAGSRQVEVHLNSRTHKKVLQAKRRQMTVDPSIRTRHQNDNIVHA